MEGRVGAERRVSVLPPMTASEASGARLSGVLETVMAGAPGVSVWPVMMYSEALFAVNV